MAPPVAGPAFPVGMRYSSGDPKDILTPMPRLPSFLSKISSVQTFFPSREGISRTQQVLAKLLLKDLNQEKSIESFIQTATILIAILAVWVFVLSRTVVTVCLDQLGIADSYFDVPPIYEIVASITDYYLKVIAAIGDGGLIKESFENAAAQVAQLNDGDGPTWKELLLEILKTPALLLGLIVVAVGAVARLRTLIALPVIVSCVIYGAAELHQQAKFGAAEYISRQVRTALASPEYMSPASGNYRSLVDDEPSAKAPPPAPAKTKTKADKYFELITKVPEDSGHLAALRGPDEIGGWFVASRVLDGVEHKMKGVILFCLQKRCAYLPAVASRQEPLFGGGNPVSYQWDRSKGVGLLAIDENLLYFNLLNSNGVRTVAQTPFSGALVSRQFAREVDEWQKKQYEKAMQVYRAPKPITQ